MSELSRILKSINMKTELLDEEFINQHYVPFVVNRVYSYFIDTCLFAWEMDNRPNMPKYDQYLYYYHNLRKRSRFAKWYKKRDDKYLPMVKEYYGYSTKHAMAALTILNETELKEIERRLDRGGKK